MTTNVIHPLSSLTSELKVLLQEDTDHRLREIVNANINTRFAGTSPALADFRLAIANKDVQNDPTVLDDFRHLVPFTDYEDYRSLISKFMERPCKLSEVENLLTPGLPDFLCFSSSTSGKKPKLFPRRCESIYHVPMANLYNAASKVMVIYSVSCKDLVEVVAESGETNHTIALSVASTARWRAYMGWSVQTDDTRMTSIVPGHVSPWATGLIARRRPFLLIHALFALAEPHLELIRASFLTAFTDMMHCIHEDWEIILSSIQDGIIPDVEHIDHVRAYLQGHMRADPKRAEELRHIGPPFSSSGWAHRVWPTLKALVCVCSGMFAAALPETKAVLGSNIAIHNQGYGTSEGLRGRSPNFDESGYFCIPVDFVEFLDVADEQTTDKLVQTWDLQPAKLYQPVFTSRDGLWRYLIDDIFQAVGFHPRNGSPMFKFHARKNVEIRLSRGIITETDLMGVIQAINAQGTVEVHEFTTVLDDRELPLTVGFFLEIDENPMSPTAELLKQQSLEAFLSMNNDHINTGLDRPPTIRIVKPGTFMEYRQWKSESKGLSQAKVPAVMSDPNALEWIAERVVREL